MSEFLFATGIENSCPTILLPDGTRHRQDELAKTCFYKRWQDDFRLVQELGINHLRYGPPYFSTHTGPGTYDWGFADQTLGALRDQHVIVIADLCHFGVPDWIGDFQNPEWPALFAAYAGAFAERYPWITYFTPVNEIFIAATFSAEYGWWNERLKTERAFVTALKHLCQANMLAMHAILQHRPEAVFIQSESTEFFHAKEPSCMERAHFLNEKRFLSLDLTYGRNIDSSMYEYLCDNGMTREELKWFRRHNLKSHCVMGNDYYVTNEHLVLPDGSTQESGEIFGYYVLTGQYFRRYRLPVMHTETNIKEPDAVFWLNKQWANLHQLKEDGVPVLGFTWYSLIDQVDWDTALRENNGRPNALGLCDLNRKIRPVGHAYKQMIEQWRQILPTESNVLGICP